MPVNGRTVTLQVLQLKLKFSKESQLMNSVLSSALPIGLSLVQRLIIEDIVNEGIPRSQLILLDELVEHVRLFTQQSRSYDDEVFCVKTELT